MSEEPKINEEVDLTMQGLHEHSTKVVDWLVCFRYMHLPTTLRDVSRPFAQLAMQIANRHLHGHAATSQTVMALEHLLIAKDAAVRAVVTI